jgi:hypothetical protein
MVFMFAVTLSALVSLFYLNFVLNQNYLLSILAVFLFVLSVVLAIQSSKRFRSEYNQSPVTIK